VAYQLSSAIHRFRELRLSLALDLPIVAAVLAAQGIFGAEQLRRSVLLGELVWTVGFGRDRVFCLRFWRLNRQVSRGSSSRYGRPEKLNWLSLVLPRSPNWSPFVRVLPHMSFSVRPDVCRSVSALKPF
jgi:hypothetical protein